MKTRIFNALNGAKGEYSRIVKKIAIYDDLGKQIDCCVLHNDKDQYEGREFYHPSNPNDEDGLFLDKIKDAITCIRDGYGDAFSSTKLLGFKMEHVVRFLDREYGENLRKKTIEGWEKTEFGYGIKFTHFNSMSGGRKLCKDYTLDGYGHKPEDVMFFETEQEAKDAVKSILNKAKAYCDEYFALPKSDDHDYYYEHICKPFFEKIEGRMEHGILSIYWEVFSAMNHSIKEGKDNYSLEVIQSIKGKPVFETPDARESASRLLNTK